MPRQDDNGGQMKPIPTWILYIPLLACLVLAVHGAVMATGAAPAEVRAQGLGGSSCQWDVLPANPWYDAPADRVTSAVAQHEA